jgi:hypothetical protein
LRRELPALLIGDQGTLQVAVFDFMLQYQNAEKHPDRNEHRCFDFA